MCLEIFEVNDLQGGLLAGRQLDLRSDSRFQGLPPSLGAQTPAIPLPQTGEIILGHGGGEVVAHGLAEGEELIRHHAADHVSSGVARRRFTGTVAEPARVQSFATGLKFFPKNVSGAILFNWRNHSAHSTSEEAKDKQENIYGVTRGLKRRSLWPDGRGSF